MKTRGLPLAACAYCGELATTWDHVVPIAAGGSNSRRNKVPACKPCNFVKSDALAAHFRRFLESNAGRWWLDQGPGRSHRDGARLFAAYDGRDHTSPTPAGFVREALAAYESKRRVPLDVAVLHREALRFGRK